MDDILPSFPMLAAFVAASFVLAITPGPAVLYIITRSISQGRSSGLASAAGVALGNMGNVIVASVGLAAIFQISAVTFWIVKYLGAGYLIYIGYQMIRSARDLDGAQAVKIEVKSLRRIFRDGFLVALFNPKTALFFASFMPQFLEADGPHLAQSLALGLIFVLLAIMTDMVYVFAATKLRKSLSNISFGARWGKTLSGTAFIGLGCLTAFSGGHKAH